MSDETIETVNDLSWFAKVLEQSRTTLEGSPESVWPSWYREHRAGGSDE